MFSRAARAFEIAVDAIGRVRLLPSRDVDARA